MSRSRLLTVGAAVVAALGVSTVALGLPWDIDMADSQAVRAYERDMKGIPEGVVAQESLLTPRGFAPNAARGSEAAATLEVPASSAASVQVGQKMYGIYCTPCHGADGVNSGPVAAPGRLPGVVPLAGPAGVAQLRGDTRIYLTVRNGGAVMPSYGHAMSDAEMWSVVHYVRTLKNAQFVPPQGEQ